MHTQLGWEDAAQLAASPVCQQRRSSGLQEGKILQVLSTLRRAPSQPTSPPGGEGGSVTPRLGSLFPTFGLR